VEVNVFYIISDKSNYAYIILGIFVISQRFVILITRFWLLPFNEIIILRMHMYIYTCKYTTYCVCVCVGVCMRTRARARNFITRIIVFNNLMNHNCALDD